MKTKVYCKTHDHFVSMDQTDSIGEIGNGEVICKDYQINKQSI